MSTLAITSASANETDFDGLVETIRVYSATLDGKPLSARHVVAQAVDDVAARTDFKAHLTILGYVWTMEV